MIDAKVWEGVQSLLDDYVGVSIDDYVVVLYTSDSAESAAWVSSALVLREISVKRVWMAPLKDDGFLKRLTATLPSPETVIGRLVILGFERDTMSHISDVANAISKFKKTDCLVFRAISASPNLFSHALRASPKDLSARNTAVLERCMTAKRLKILTDSGTNLSIIIDPKHRWISNRGVANPGGVVILPAGEVATFPASINGIFVADFAFNVNAITDRDSRLQNHPITILIEDGRAVKFECSDNLTSQFLEECFNTHCAYNVGELGFGTNPCIDDAIPMNSHINERRPGIHIGFGQHNQDLSIVGYQCAIHLDLIAKGGIVWVDDDPHPINMENIMPSSQSHPRNTQTADVFSPGTEELEIDDCCGFLTSEGLQLFTSPDCPIPNRNLLD